MHSAPRYDPLASSTVFPKGSSAQPIVEGTVSRELNVLDREVLGGLREDDHLYTGKANGEIATTFPFAITAADLDRGQERFDIYCSPCHGRTGEGRGMVVQRGYRQPPSYHIDRLRKVPVGYLFDVITNGFGAMPDYAAQIPADDRWAIVAYVRALQLSEHATLADVPAADREKLR
jgi:mono/diheme cytochrome c family protein